MSRRRPVAFRQQPAALDRRCRARRRRYRRLVLRRRRLEAIRRRWPVGKEQQPADLVRPCRARRRAPDAHRSRRLPAVWHRPAAVSCRGSAQSRRSRGILHPAAPSCCSVPRGRRLDDMRDPLATPVLVSCSMAAGLTTCLATRRPSILAQWPTAAGLMGTLPARRDPVSPGRRLAIGVETTATVTTGLLISLILADRRRAQVAASKSAPVLQVPSPAAVRVVRFEGRLSVAAGLRRLTSRRRLTTAARRHSTAARIPPPTAVSAVTVGRLLPTAAGLILLPGSRRLPLVTRRQRCPSRSFSQVSTTLVEINPWSRAPAAGRRQ